MTRSSATRCGHDTGRDKTHTAPWPSIRITRISASSTVGSHGGAAAGARCLDYTMCTDCPVRMQRTPRPSVRIKARLSWQCSEDVSAHSDERSACAGRCGMVGMRRRETRSGGCENEKCVAAERANEAWLGRKHGGQVRACCDKRGVHAERRGQRGYGARQGEGRRDGGTSEKKRWAGNGVSRAHTKTRGKQFRVS